MPSTGPLMNLSFRQFPDRTQVPNTPLINTHIFGDLQQNLNAPPQIVALDPDPGKPPLKYDFLFWHVYRMLVSTPVVTFTVPATVSQFFATAWYAREGSGNGGQPAVGTVAFSTDRDEVIPETPITSVTPPGAWAGPPSAVVSTTTSAAPVVITAKTLIEGSGEFESWLTFVTGLSTSGRTLTALAGTSALAIAYYGVPQPDPCAQLRATRDGLNPGDFPSLPAFERALAAANTRLHECEKRHGEPLD